MSAAQQIPPVVLDEEEHVSLVGSSKSKRPKSVQEQLLSEMGALDKEIASYSEFVMKRGAEIRPEQQKQLKKLREEKDNKEKLLKRKKIEAKSSQKVREKKAKVLADLKKRSS